MARSCPQCGARAWARDYAPARTYALLLFGLFLLLLGRLVLPPFETRFDMQVWFPALAAATDVQAKALMPAMEVIERQQALAGQQLDAAIRLCLQLGVIACFMGCVDYATHRNRFCVACGLRVRLPRKELDKRTLAALRSCQPPAREPTAPAGDGSAAPCGAPPLAPTQPVGPLIKMLRLRNEGRRADALATLRALTDKDFGMDVEAWEQWWHAERERRAAP